MPGRDGVETAREIRRLAGDEPPILILSAYDWSEAEVQARGAGIQAFAEKPLSRSRPVYALKSALAGNAGGQKLAPAELGGDRSRGQAGALSEGP